MTKKKSGTVWTEESRTPAGEGMNAGRTGSGGVISVSAEKKRAGPFQAGCVHSPMPVLELTAEKM